MSNLDDVTPSAGSVRLRLWSSILAIFVTAESLALLYGVVTQGAPHQPEVREEVAASPWRDSLSLPLALLVTAAWAGLPEGVAIAASVLLLIRFYRREEEMTPPLGAILVVVILGAIGVHARMLVWLNTWGS